MSTPTLGLTCTCGRSRVTPCATLDLILEGVVAATLEGWGYDQRGFVRCPECLPLVTANPAPIAVQIAVQGVLFD